MEFLDLIEKRRSVRAYDAAAPITKETIEKIIYAAQQAPSWKNSQTGRYYVAMSSEKVEEIRTNCLPEFNRERTENVCAYIVTAFKKNVSGFSPDGAPVDSLENSWGAYDLGLQNQNLVLCAKELGYDTLIMGLKDNVALRKIFNILDDEQIMSVIAIGKGAISPEKPKRKNTEEILKVM